MANQPVTETGSGHGGIGVVGEVSTKVLRDFGLLIAGAALVYGLWPWVLRGEPFRLWALVIGGAFGLLGLAAPVLLALPYKSWMFLGGILGWINTRIILGVLYYGLIVPMGLVMKMMGRDPMRRVLVPSAETYRVVRQRRDPSHMNNMF